MKVRSCFAGMIAIAFGATISIGCARRTLDAPGVDGGGMAGASASGAGAGGGGAGDDGVGGAGAANSGAAGAAGGGGGSIGADRPSIDIKAIGQPCLFAEECVTAFCADGVCCNTACTGDCMRCNTAGSVGVCGAVPSGSPPRTAGACPVEVALTCGNDGTCDGAGACRLRAIGTVCAAGSCDGSAVVGQKVCDGRGACRAGPAVICAPYLCDPASATCRTSCTTDADCPGSACESTGRCHVMGGAACTRNAECASGFCVAGICCNTACVGQCQACNVPGRVGTCSPQPSCTADAATD